MLFDYLNKKLNFTTKDNICFNLDLRGNINIIRSESATGKTYLATMLKALRQTGVNNNLKNQDSINVRIFDEQISADDLKKCSSDLIIIDRADICLSDNEKTVNYINGDLNNIYLIFARRGLGLSVSPNYVADFEREGNVISLKYKYSVKGWY